MYAVAARLDPDSYLALARAVYAEMALAGVTSVGEFHYLHHGPGGVPYDDPNAMGAALRAAAADAGIRLTLLDTCYLAGGFDTATGRPVQQRFGDGDVDAWAERAAAAPTAWRVHSVRAVPRDALRRRRGPPRAVRCTCTSPSSPPRTRRASRRHGLTPTGLLAAEGVLGPATTAVHATHLTDADIALLGGTGTGVCLCPTTERDLADGIGPARALADAGAPLSLGSDQHAVIDLFEEARALEMHERLATGERGRFRPAELLAALTGHAAAGLARTRARSRSARPPTWSRCALDTVRTAGADPAQVLLAATAADVDTVVVDGRPVVEGGAAPARRRRRAAGARDRGPPMTHTVGGSRTLRTLCVNHRRRA